MGKGQGAAEEGGVLIRAATQLTNGKTLAVVLFLAWPSRNRCA